ncbi:DUF7287 family protein [Haloarcula amylovorans]|uniref:DUF7287 family protein n=1 Tax=Haloarcula amylovorans TaxID=2562280 RepID=UPI001076483C|nr:hypothetical protein [Halomicroarcula amylolytica]
MRGQTTLDFAIGMSLFLAVLLFVFLFIPGILAPFTEGTQEETVVSNRVADQLTKSVLADPSEPFVLEEYCTVAFFEGNSPGQCSYGSGPVESQLGLDEKRQNLNVTVRGNVSAAGSGNDVLCWDRDEPDTGIVEARGGACDSSDVVLTRGDAPPRANDASVTAVRVVALDGSDVTVYVGVW